MARARTIKPQFLESRSMRAVSAMARLTFIQLWLLADDAGRLVVYSTLPRRLFPGDAEALTLFPGWLDELEAQRCIERYTVEGWPYLRIVNWDRHQRIYHPTRSRLPARPPGFAKESGAIREARAFFDAQRRLPNAPWGVRDVRWDYSTLTPVYSIICFQ
jgi:hypothetical protein